MKSSSSSSGVREILRKLAIYGAVVLTAIYVLGVGAGYGWLRYARKNDQVSLLDVALFRITAIRRSIAAKHFADAQAEWDQKNLQAAYLYFSAGVRQDPDNVTGRMTAVRFLRSVGANGVALTMLEEGLARAPDDRQLIEATFDLLLASGRDRKALEVLRQRYGTELSGPNSALLQRYEVEATLAADGPLAAKAILEKRPSLLQNALASRTIARVFWETQERLKAITLLQQYLTSEKGVIADYTQLATWQESTGQASDAVQTARRAMEKFPGEIPPRVLLIEMLAAESPAGSALPAAIADFLRDFGHKPEAVAELSILAGRKGWVDLSRSLYEVSVNRQQDVTLLALSYADALARVSRFKEVQRVLQELEIQVPEGNQALWIQVRQRQVIAAAALGDSDNVREYARRLGAVLGRDPDGLETCRRLFGKLGIADAVAELSSRSLTANTVAKK